MLGTPDSQLSPKLDELYGHSFGRCRCETIFWPPLYIDPGVNISYDILTPGSIYRNDILTLLTIFWPPPLNSTWNSFVAYAQLLNVVYCYIYIIFMNSERMGVEQVYQNKMRFWFASRRSCFNLQLLKPFTTLWSYVLVMQNESITNTQEDFNIIIHLLK